MLKSIKNLSHLKMDVTSYHVWNIFAFFYLYMHVFVNRTRGGKLTLQSGTGMCRGYDPLFSGQSALSSLPIYHQCAAQVPPIFKFLKKNCIFSLVLAKILALKTQIFVPKTPHFSRKICSLDPTLETRVAHTHQKKKVECPPREQI